MTEQQLLNLKDEVEKSKTKVSELQGQLKALNKQLIDDWKCKTIKEGKRKLQEIKISNSSINKKIEKKTEELEEKYEIQ